MFTLKPTEIRNCEDTVVVQKNASTKETVRQEILLACQEWVRRFNIGDYKYTIDTYLPNAKMYPRNTKTPRLPVEQRNNIGQWWKTFLDTTGAKNLVYYNVEVKVTGPNSGDLSARWYMSVGSGHIDKETWIKNDGKWSLAFDDFTVEETHSPTGAVEKHRSDVMEPASSLSE
ncbi:unnamed protein product [Didymodactylos carnosus]|uniref:SnoaL-like domain-containing protein n=1 Tax=Didymodactylos carnosus TaxID=1234261 RepID=A0A814TGR2_9BILA|nr:unnamed protein product [Didymodactylos carnosus]CAF3925114.1 unnamed protein product [Didymodactylos carnosus]